MLKHVPYQNIEHMYDLDSIILHPSSSYANDTWQTGCPVMLGDQIHFYVTLFVYPPTAPFTETVWLRLGHGQTIAHCFIRHASLTSTSIQLNCRLMLIKYRDTLYDHSASRAKYLVKKTISE